MKPRYIKDAIYWNGYAAENGAWLRISDVNYIEPRYVQKSCGTVKYTVKDGGYYTPSCPGPGLLMIREVYPYEDWMYDYIGTNKNLREDERFTFENLIPVNDIR